jgi:hypothetical protein
MIDPSIAESGRMIAKSACMHACMHIDPIRSDPIESNPSAFCMHA